MSQALTSRHSFAKLKAFKKRPRILSLTGCFVERIGASLSEYCDVDHLWRVTLPMIAGEAYTGRNFFRSDIDGVAERLNYELSRAYFEKIVNTNYDIVLFDVVSEFSNDYFEKNGTIITDITCGLMGANWQWPGDFDVGSWNRIRPTDPNYAELYIRSLTDVLERKIFGDAKVVLVKRKLCRTAYFSNGFQVTNDNDIDFQTAIIDRLQESVSRFTNVEVIDLGYDNVLTDEWAPSGSGKFHPSEEYYLLMLDRVCDHFSIGPDFRARLMQSSISEIKKRRYAEQAELKAQIEVLTGERENLSVQAQAVSDARNEAAGQLQAVLGEQGLLKEQVSAALAERDILAGRLDAMAAEREALLAQISNLHELSNAGPSASDQDGLGGRIDSLTSERDAFSAQAAALAVELEAQAVANRQLTSERDALSGSLSEALAQRNDLAARNETLSSELAAAVEASRMFGAERESSASIVSEAFAQRDDLAARIEALTAELSAAVESCRLLEAERENAYSQVSEAVAQRDQLAARSETLVAELAAATEARQSLAVERDALANQLSASSTQRDEIAAQLYQVKGERDRLAARAEASALENAYAGELARLGNKLENLFAHTDRGRQEQLSRIESMLGKVRAEPERALVPPAERADSVGSILPALRKQASEAQAEAARLTAFREKLIMELRFDDGPKALKAVLPMARMIRGTVNLFRPRRNV